MIQINDLKKVYKGDVQALRGINLEIGEGMFGLLGPNGAGKTTLMRILSGIVEASSGSLKILGYDARTPEGRQMVKLKLGYLPQEMGLYPNLSAREFLDYVGILKGMTSKYARHQQIDELLSRVRLLDTANRPLKTYSGGMKRRVGIAQAMLGDPALLIVDEPTVGLDPEERVRIRNILSEMSQRCTVILSTHVIEDIGHSCNDLAIINKGTVLFQGAPSTLIERARGHVWTVTTQGEQPDPSLQIVSTMQFPDRVQFRVLGQPSTNTRAEQIEPGLEDGYMLLMQQKTAQPT